MIEGFVAFIIDDQIYTNFILRTNYGKEKMEF